MQTENIEFSETEKLSFIKFIFKGHEVAKYDNQGRFIIFYDGLFFHTELEKMNHVRIEIDHIKLDLGNKDRLVVVVRFRK